MFNKFMKLGKFTKLATAFALVATVGATALIASANAGTTQCWRCVGGWCCY